jgi:hypothetical protein
MKPMSVFYHSGDPLLTTPTQSFSLFQTPNGNNANLSEAYAQIYRQQMMDASQKEALRDWLGELDQELKGLDETTAETLNNDLEFTELNSKLQGMVQREIMNVVKTKINADSEASQLIRKQIDRVRDVAQKVRNEEKQSMNELNDYLKNYSHLSFNEYKRIKDGDKQDKAETVEPNKRKKK